MKILAIETSCDDTGIAVLEAKSDKNSHGRNSHEITPFACPKILSNLVSSQVKVHAAWGGVVPMLAKREHQNNLTPLLIKALEKAKLLKISKSKFLISKQISNSKIQTLKKILDREPELLKKHLSFLQKYQKPNIDFIAVTHGPGLEPALWVGVNFSRALSYFWNIPIIPINHIEGHLTAALAVDGQGRGTSNFQFPIFKKMLPAIALVVSGGHTQLILVKKSHSHVRNSHEFAPFGYQIIGETRDDAAGEAFDKVAKMLDLGYPGGPAISRLAEKWNSQFPISNFQIKTKSKDSRQRTTHSTAQSLDHFSFPRPMLNSGDLDFSFSGLKTAVLYTLQKMTPAQIKKSTPAIASQFQQAVVDVLTAKTLAAAKKHKAKTIILAGGVAANPLLRQSLSLAAGRSSLNFLAPPLNLCADNAAMIGLSAAWRLSQRRAKKTSWRPLKAQANLRIS